MRQSWSLQTELVSRDGVWQAVVERREGRDVLLLLDRDWQLVRQTTLPTQERC